MREAFLTLIVAIVIAVFGFAWNSADNEHSRLYEERDALGLSFGCSQEYPVLATNNSTGRTACYQRTACTFYWRPSCTGLTLDAKYLAAWEALSERRDSVDVRRGTFGSLAVVLGYLLVGWHLHTLVLALLRRFMLPKWALLVALAVNVITLNVVGGVRSIVSLLKLPARESETRSAPIA